MLRASLNIAKAWGRVSKEKKVPKKSGKKKAQELDDGEPLNVSVSEAATESDNPFGDDECLPGKRDLLKSVRGQELAVELIERAVELFRTAPSFLSPSSESYSHSVETLIRFHLLNIHSPKLAPTISLPLYFLTVLLALPTLMLLLALALPGFLQESLPSMVYRPSCRHCTETLNLGKHSARS